MNAMIKIATLLTAATLMLASCDSSQLASQRNQSANTQPAQQATPTYTAPTLVRKANFGTWWYFAQKMGSDTITPFGGTQIKPGDVFAKVNYKNDTATDVRAYAATNRSQLQKVVDAGGQTEAWITFRTYVSANDFRAFVKSHRLSNPQSQLRAIDETKSADNKYITMQIGPRADDPDPLPQVYMNFYQGIQSDHNPNAIFEGIYFTRAWVDAQELAAIANDPKVYFIDITPNLVRMDLAANGIENADKVDVEVEPANPFYTMELAGLDQFK